MIRQKKIARTCWAFIMLICGSLNAQVEVATNGDVTVGTPLGGSSTKFVVNNNTNPNTVNNIISTLYNGSVDQKSIYSYLSGGTGGKTGIYNLVDQPGASFSLGINQSTSSSGSGSITGISNFIPGSGTGQRIGYESNIFQPAGVTSSAYGFNNVLWLNSATSGFNIALWNRVISSSASNNLQYGIYNDLNTQNSNNGIALYSRITGASTNYAGFFEGAPVYFDRPIIQASDANLKENVKDANNMLEKILKMRSKTYNLKEDKKAKKDTEYGFIAQELELVLPEVVRDVNVPEKRNTIAKKEPLAIPAVTDANGAVIIPAKTIERFVPESVIEAQAVSIKAVNYNALIAILVSGIQEQQALIEAQQTQIKAMQADLDKIKKKVGE
jgi:Chaperone of endosialidase